MLPLVSEIWRGSKLSAGPILPPLPYTFFVFRGKMLMTSTHTEATGNMSDFRRLKHPGPFLQPKPESRDTGRQKILLLQCRYITSFKNNRFSTLLSISQKLKSFDCFSHSSKPTSYTDKDRTLITTLAQLPQTFPHI
ncbi:unnamed protein product [Chrysodeixis includens]|uniref:Uncharacterized protein n=1 Tax=Chrysodeixis includens TaxID=689277 RepID=A0A9P0FY17_CHRIL|nr:unnamed protein product [Chrysodeixis includens]